MLATDGRLARWFPCLLAVLSVAITLVLVTLTTTPAAVAQAALALVLAGGLFVVGYRRYATTDLPATEARRVATWAAGGFGVFLVMDLWFRGLEVVFGPGTPGVAAVTSLTAGTLGGAIAGIETARRHRQHAARAARLEDYRVIFEEIEDAILVHDAETFAIRDANPKGEELIGYTVEELQEMDVMDVTAAHPEVDEAEARTRLETAIEHGADRFEWPIERRDGAHRWLQVSLKRATLHNQRVVLAVLRDITEQKERRQELEQYETLAETVQDGLYATSADGEFTYVNDAMCDLAGHDREELVGAHFSSLLDEDALEQVVEGRERARGAPDTTTSLEIDIQRGDGGTVPAETRFTALDSKGEFAGTVGVIRDVSDHREYERHLRTLHAVTRDLVTESDPDAIAARSCAAFQDLLDYPVNTVFRQSGDELVPVASSDGAETLFDGIPSLPAGESLAWEVYETSEPQVHGHVSEAPDAYDPDSPVESEAIFPLGSLGVVIVGSPEPEAFSTQDIELIQVLVANTRVALDRARVVQTLREREAELAERNERLDRFADLVAHDLQNPLTTATGWLEMARESGEPADFERVASAHERMEAIVTDLLDLAQTSGEVELTDRVDIGWVADQVWQSIDAEAATLRIEDSGTVAADASRLRQVFENLLRNAVVHGGPDVTIRVGTLPDGFYVEDTGPGIPSGERETVLQPGYTTHEEGTGFGLVVVDQLVSAHGWNVGVTAADGGGARFEIRGVTFTDTG